MYVQLLLSGMASTVSQLRQVNRFHEKKAKVISGIYDIYLQD